MTAAHRNHNMSDAVRERLRLNPLGEEGKQGIPTQDNRRFYDAMAGF